MMFVTFGLLFGLGTLLWCVALSIFQSFRGEREVGYSWDPATRDEECSVTSDGWRQGGISSSSLLPGRGSSNLIVGHVVPCSFDSSDARLS
jgi:hypothetical protein